ncbi:MAG: DegV family protein [Dehalococcoidales bacterium]|nr:DegV family protein [Dehalococcoidales bacterium]
MTNISPKKVAIITDSVACLTRELATRYSIGIVPLRIIYEGKTYGDWVDITPNEAYELFLKKPDAFNTSTPPPTDFMGAFKQASKQASRILYIALSSKLSTTVNSAHLAREYARTELPGVQIEIVDSFTATAAEGFIALASARAAEEGKELAEVVKIAEEMKGKVHTLVLLDTIRHVYRSGRVPRIASIAGSMISLRPLLNVSGGVNFCGIARSRKNGIELLFRKTRDLVGKKPVHMAVTHAYALEEAEKLKKRASEEFNCVELWVSEFSPIMGYACGTGTLGLAFYTED